MGGAAGHMAHPFDCREVRNGQDLINFYVKVVNTIPLYDEQADKNSISSVSLKLDGVNASFRLQKADNAAGFKFVLDRGGKTPGTYTKYDFDGVTPDNAVQRFKGNKEHGMIQVVDHMTKMLNHDLMKLRPYVEALGLFERMGPEGVFFDAEYYSNSDKERGYKPIKNAIDYNQNFIAIHRLSEFYTETGESKKGVPTKRRLTRGFYWETIEEINNLLKQKDELLAQRKNTSDIDQLIAEKNNELRAKKQEHQKVLDDLAKAVQQHASDLKMPFNVHTKIGLRLKEGLTRENVLKNIQKVLDMKVPYSYKRVDEKKSIGPVKINEQTGEIEARTLKELLLGITKNPAHVAYYPDTPGFTKDGQSVKGKIKTKAGYKKDPKQSAFALDIYRDIMVNGLESGIGAADIGESEKDVQAINSAVVLLHAVRHIGNVLKKSVVADEDLGPDVENQEGIVIQSANICDGIAFKFTGEFMLDNADRGFGVTPRGKDIPSDSAEALFETKIKYGELLESFMVKTEIVAEQEERYAIMIPGGFKPPTAGHYSMIKYYENQSNVEKVFVVTGHKPRGNVSLYQSKLIFDIYGGFSDKVVFLTTKRKSPLEECYELAKDKKFLKQYPNLTFSIGASDKDSDKLRIDSFEAYFKKRPGLTSANITSYPAAPAYEVDGKAASASRMRAAYQNGEWEEFKKMLPGDDYYNDVVQVLNKQTSLIPVPLEEAAESKDFFTMDYLFSLVDEMLLERKRKKKSLSDRVSDKISYLIRKEKRPQKQAVAIALSLRDRGELEEQEEDPLQFNQDLANSDQVDQQIAALVAQMRNISDAQKEDIIARVSARVKDLLGIAAREDTDTDAQAAQKLTATAATGLEEESGVGGIAGYAGPLKKTGDKNDEQSIIRGA